MPRSGEAWPIGRVEHAACCLGFGEHPQLLLVGGLYESNKTLNDIWILDLERMKWKEVSMHVLACDNIELCITVITATS